MSTPPVKSRVLFPMSASLCHCLSRPTISAFLAHWHASPSLPLSLSLSSLLSVASSVSSPQYKVAPVFQWASRGRHLQHLLSAWHLMSSISIDSAVFETHLSPNRLDGSRISSPEEIRASSEIEFPILLEMASSLEDLLAEEGFKGKKFMARSRTSLGSDKVTTPRYGSRDRLKSDSLSSNRTKTQRTISDASRYSFSGRLGGCDSTGARRPRDILITRERIDGKHTEVPEGKRSVERLAGRALEVHSNDFSGHEIVDVGAEKGERVMDMYPIVIDGRDGSMGKDMKSNRRDRDYCSKKNLLGDPFSGNNGGTSTKQSGPLDDRTKRGLWNNKSFQDSSKEKHAHSIFSDSLPALDEVAIRAVVSILTGYMKPFLMDRDFRVSLRDKCFSSINFVGSEVYQDTESKVIFNLEQAIETVERAVEDNASAKDLKRASLQLSVITGLNSGEVKDGLTCGIPNYKLSACAHLYLSVIYKLHEKDRVSAKHILQVFSASPLQGRTLLLPELWESVFYPHLSHLKLWHSQEVDSLVDTPNRARKLKLLNKKYNEILDSGTYQFAVYYKDWLTEGSGAPSFPSISIPSVSIQTGQLSDSLGHSGELSSPVSAPYPQPMINKKLYEAVFGRPSKPGAEDDEVGENNWNCMKGSGDSSFDAKESWSFCYETVKHMDQQSIANPTKSVEDEELPEDELLLGVDIGRGILEADISPREDKANEGSGSSFLQQASIEAELRHSPEMDNASELKRLAISVFEPEKTDGPDIKVDIPIRSDEQPVLEHLGNVIEANPSSQVLRGIREYSDEGPFAIPHYLICPLTGQLFEDPVTLETGHTFERAAIRKWFDEGNKTCPVTGRSLECLTTPLTNVVIKCALDSWKSSHCKNILAFASRIMEENQSREFSHLDDGSLSILEQLVTICSKDERIENVKHLISLGGVLYLVRRFEFGTIEEKMRVAALLLCCIEADAGCRDQISESINIQCLLELLHSKEIEARRNAVSLLTQLVCLSRRKDRNILSGLPNEEIVNVMHVLLLYLRSSRCEERALVAVLLLRLDLLVGPQKYSIYREEAVDAIALALNLSLIDETIKSECCKALSVLGGCFSLSGTSTEIWALEQAAKLNVVGKENFEDNKEHGPSEDDAILSFEEDLAHTQWLRYLLTSLLGNEKKSFLEGISKCLASKESNLVRVSLTTVAWLSSAFSSLSDAEFQLSAFSALICQLKENLESGEEMEHKILASFSLLNFSKIPECRVLLMTIAEEIASPLRIIADVTWTAKQLYAIISKEGM